MPSAFERGLQILELLAGREGGLPLRDIAETLDMPRSAAHRLLAELIETGFVHQKGELGDYVLGLKIAALGLKHLAANDLVGVSQPILDELADMSRELVRLAVVDADGHDMLWVAKAQGMRAGLKYDPESGGSVTLSCTANGIVWMSFLSEADALTRILAQGIVSKADAGPNALQTIDELRAEMQRTRERGFAIADETFSVGLASVAVPVFDGSTVVGALSIAGPTARLSEERLVELSGPLIEAATRLSSVFAQSSRELTAHRAV